MKRLSINLLSLLCALILGACGGGEVRSMAEFSSMLYEPRYATGFDIRGAEDAASTIITVRNPWQGAEGVEQQLFIARNGEKAPKGFVGQTLNGAAQRVVCMSSTYVAMIDALDCVDRVVGVSGIGYIYNPHIQAAAEDGRVCDVGHDSDINFELLLSLQPDIVLIYGVSGENGTANAKLKELGIPYFYLGDYVEESPLGKAEWLVAMAEILGESERGKEHFLQIEERYLSIVNRLKDEEELSHPTVMFNTPYRDTWYMPSSRSYAVRLVEDAGGRYIYDGNNGTTSAPIDLEQAYVLTRVADYWINVGQVASIEALKRDNPHFADAKAVREGRVYSSDRRTTAAGGSDFWESAVVNPDVVLADLVAILHPELNIVGEELTYYKRLK
ncbi:MAG: ABC transporter substrate-binding protein [Rikenellaceae bacterium]|nr:ABC transporter substrate-binding protein [Rikenellaceae bacterium]